MSTDAEDEEMEELFSFGSSNANSLAVDPPERERARTADSLEKLLSVHDDSVPNAAATAAATTATTAPMDEETLEILSWLDQPEENDKEEEEEASEERVVFDETDNEMPQEERPILHQLEETHTFETLAQALASPHSTLSQIRTLFGNQDYNIQDEALRPQLWVRMVCDKTMEQIQLSSNAQAFQDFYQDYTAAATTTTTTTDPWIHQEALIWSERIVHHHDKDDQQQQQQQILALEALVIFATPHPDRLLLPVACTLLAAGLSPPVASVVLAQIMPSHMPLLRLTHDDRIQASRTLHQQFYLLAAYHLPLLVFHLDRHVPGWHWPQPTANDTTRSSWKLQEGLLPPSWLVSHLAGECQGSSIPMPHLLRLWDLILVSSNNSLRFFLVLALLEHSSNALLLKTGQELILEWNRMGNDSIGGFAIQDDVTPDEAMDWVQEWCRKAQDLHRDTPTSVVTKLRRAEDEAVAKALSAQTARTEAALQAQLDQHAKEHEQALEREREIQAEQGRQRINRARLVAFYRKYNPSKEANIDKIMESYQGRLDQLDSQLKKKYGQGFHPALKPSQTINKLSTTMIQGIASQRKRLSQVLKKEDEKPNTFSCQVTVTVTPQEVLPVVCWSKELKKPTHSLKYYLVDARPQQDQGRFPTALALPPESLLDPEALQQQEDFFESLRGAAHIVVMGQGFAAISELYDGSSFLPADQMEQLIAEDESSTSLCALFFVKRGFPFVSILEGGFCGAHAWLCREGPKHHLNVHSVLVDYAGEESLFGRLEKAHQEQLEFANASAGEKTQLALQGLLDKSLTSIARNKIRLESAATSFFAADSTPKPSPARPTKKKVLVEPTVAAPFAAEESTSSKPATSASNKPTIAAMPATTTSAAPPTQEPPPTGTAPLKKENGAPAATTQPRTSAPAPKPPAAADSIKNRLEGIGNRFAAVSSNVANNRFAGLGAALNKIAPTAGAPQPQIPQVLKRNPFSRFVQEQPAEEKQQQRFGLNQVRNPLAGLRGNKPEGPEEGVVNFDDVVAEPPSAATRSATESTDQVPKHEAEIKFT